VTLSRFEDIEAWKKARELTQAVYRATSVRMFARDPSLRDQIRRASVSNVSNIAEGFERGGNREFSHFLSTAKGSASEVKAQLYVALDAGFLGQVEFDQLYRLADETSRLIGGFLRYLRRTDYRGVKFTPSSSPELRTQNRELRTPNSEQ
jgi:four helix bundle protein